MYIYIYVCVCPHALSDRTRSKFGLLKAASLLSFFLLTAAGENTSVWQISLVRGELGVNRGFLFFCSCKHRIFEPV